VQFVVRHTLAAALGLTAVLQAQERTISDAVRPFVSVDAAVVALTHIQLVDGTGAPAKADQTVILRNGTIDAVGASATTSVPPGAQELELPGHTVLPGQVGLHEHTYFATIDAGSGGVERLTPMNRSGPLLYLAYGVTTAMTAGTPYPYQELNLKRAVDAGDIPGPRFLTTGIYLTGRSRNPMFRSTTTPEEVRRVIAYWASEGATWIKFHTATTRELLKAGIEEAHARGLRVTGHLCAVTFTEASALGIDLLQHGLITNSEYVPGKEPDRCPPENQRAQADVDVSSPAVLQSIRTLVAARTPVASTLGAYETFIPGRLTLDARVLEPLEPEERKNVETVQKGLGGRDWALPPRMLTKMMEWERAFVAAGGLLGSGSDPWGTGNMPGVGNLRNYELLVEAGFTPEQATQIMTLNGARIIGEEQQLGSVTPGKTADLFVVEGDPVRTPADIYKVETVFRGGIGYDAARLRRAAAGLVGLN
jgi:cytosine/adenosine deaminase-related metal-dependent hydrolase